MNHIDTMRLALDALLSNRLGDGNEAITALQAALAEPSEPVARQFQGRDGTWHPFIDERHYENTVADGSWPIRNLYLHPPVHQPLSDEEISEVFEKYASLHPVPVNDGFIVFSTLVGLPEGIEFARAIEQAIRGKA
jgi:hypothetical protein